MVPCIVPPPMRPTVPGGPWSGAAALLWRGCPARAQHRHGCASAGVGPHMGGEGSERKGTLEGCAHTSEERNSHSKCMNNVYIIFKKYVNKKLNINMFF